MGVADLDIRHTRGPEQVDPGFEVSLPQVVLEPAAVELPSSGSGLRRRPALDALGQAAVVAGGEPEAQAALAGSDPLLHVVHQAENFAEVVAGDLLRGLPDLERGLGGGPEALLGNEDARVGSLLLELQPERQPGEPPTKYCHVVGPGRMPIVTHIALLSRTTPVDAAVSRPLARSYPRWAPEEASGCPCHGRTSRQVATDQRYCIQPFHRDRPIWYRCRVKGGARAGPPLGSIATPSRDEPGSHRG